MEAALSAVKKESASAKMIAGMHVVFWAGVLLLSYFIFSGFLPAQAALKRTLIVLSFIVTIFYINSLFLINYLFESKKYAWYVLGLIVLSALALRIKFFLDFRFLNDQAPFLKMAGKNTSYLVSSFPVIFCLVFGTLYQMLVNRFRKEKMLRARINEFSEAQLKFLKSQINPHFLFNNLNNIYSLVVTQSEKAPDMILKLSELLRYVIYKSDASKVSVSEELEQIRNLVELFKLKDEDIQHVVIDDSKLGRQGFISPMMLIPLVENCLKHWDGSTNTDGFIEITIASDEREFNFTTRNSAGVKMKNENRGEGGVGLENIRKRLQLVYGDKAELTTGETNGIFKANLKISW